MDLSFKAWHGKKIGCDVFSFRLLDFDILNKLKAYNNEELSA